MLDALFVVLGASLWATDTLFRHPLVGQFSPITIVLVEHLIATAAALLFALLYLAYKTKRANKNIIKEFPWQDLMLPLSSLTGVALIGVFGSALATVLFTYSFSYVNPTVSILLQKIQPLLVIALSAIFLNERLPKYFLVFALVALTSAFFLSFPHGINVQDLKEADSKGVFLALCAAAFWAVSTVIGKRLLIKNLSSSVLSFWRFLFGLGGMLALTTLSPQSEIDLAFITVDPAIMRSLFYMAVVPGLLGVSLYYRGLSKVPASVTTILELSFPLSAMILNSIVLHLPLQMSQLAAALVLLGSMAALSLSKKNNA